MSVWLKRWVWLVWMRSGVRNRATPRTQSALLEAMSDRQVSVDGQTRPLGSPFFVLATQNPFEFEGTFPLPESQMDRFLMRLHLGYPDLEQEITVLREQRVFGSMDEIGPVTTGEEMNSAIANESRRGSACRISTTALSMIRSKPDRLAGARQLSDKGHYHIFSPRVQRQVGDWLVLVVAGIDDDLHLAVAVLRRHRQPLRLDRSLCPVDDLLPELRVHLRPGPVAIPAAQFELATASLRPDWQIVRSQSVFRC